MHNVSVNVYCTEKIGVLPNNSFSNLPTDGESLFLYLNGARLPAHELKGARLPAHELKGARFPAQELKGARLLRCGICPGRGGE